MNALSRINLVGNTNTKALDNSCFSSCVLDFLKEKLLRNIPAPYLKNLKHISKFDLGRLGVKVGKAVDMFDLISMIDAEYKELRKDRDALKKEHLSLQETNSQLNFEKDELKLQNAVLINENHLLKHKPISKQLQSINNIRNKKVHLEYDSFFLEHYLPLARGYVFAKLYYNTSRSIKDKCDTMLYKVLVGKDLTSSVLNAEIISESTCLISVGSKIQQLLANQELFQNQGECSRRNPVSDKMLVHLQNVWTVDVLKGGELVCGKDKYVANYFNILEGSVMKSKYEQEQLDKQQQDDKEIDDLIKTHAEEMQDWSFVVQQQEKRIKFLEKDKKELESRIEKFKDAFRKCTNFYDSKEMAQKKQSFKDALPQKEADLALADHVCNLIGDNSNEEQI